MTIIHPLFVLLQVFLLWLSADFITGMVHWWQDAYGNPTWPIIGTFIIQPNLRHHHCPREMLKLSYWQRINTSIITAAAIIGMCLWREWCPWQLIVGICFASQGNEIHAMGHRSDRENGKVVQFLQKIGLIQRRRTHGWHHKAPYDTNFFVMTEYLNPFFNKIYFFEKLEWVIQKVLHVKPIRGASVRGGV